jgi:hypothetical protein
LAKRPRVRHAIVVWVAGILACAHPASTVPPPEHPVSSPAAAAPQEPPKPNIALAVAALVAKHGEASRARIERGVTQLAGVWRPEDSDFQAFALEQFIADPKLLDATFERLEGVFEQLDGHFNELYRELKRATDLDVGPTLPVDSMLSSVDASAHITEDLFASKVGGLILLNFPLATLDEQIAHGSTWTRRQWAELRLAQRFARRVPGEVAQQIARSGSQADLYIAEYNLWMHHVLSEKGERLFPKDLRLISHWNLRDELKADYADPRALDKQRTLVRLMEQIVTQQIPAAAVDNPRVDWNPFSGAVSPTPAAELEANLPPEHGAGPGPEPDTRYARLLGQFRANRLADPYSPSEPTLIARSFELGRQIPEQRVKGLLTQVLASSQVSKVAAVIQSRLGRPLEPQDLWYNGFQPRARMSDAELDPICRKRYPTPAAFAADIPRILEHLGFSKQKAHFVAEHVIVDAARGAGHALQAMRRGDFPHLRTRVEPNGMNYKGYNIAVHELGHNVEQVFSLYEVDHTLLQGVPNSAFTEALAFVFQARDLDLLGLAKPDAQSERARVLNDFWQTWEIAGVALVDIAAWHWMYEHPDATPAQLRDAVAQASRDVWNQYYAPVLGKKDSPLLGIYSHMIAYPLYLPDYPLGHMIAFQIEEQIKKSGAVGPEFERMAKLGAVAPDVWMQAATGAPVSAEPLLRATEAAL